ncbi:hypothetical protein [Winogradskyella pulchriflava]|uniref:Homeodomain-like domain-containing protein n=1 Tax=Winogradskyella pulchriflava TaxID=1110688 RepID=A0ABV6QCE7_9FLAO
MKVVELNTALTPSDYTEIESLAEQNYGPRDIAKVLRVSVRTFLHVWRDKNSQIRKAYDLGRFQIEIKKSEKLISMIDNENTTAIQIHNKQSEERDFEDARLDVFGF